MSDQGIEKNVEQQPSTDAPQKFSDLVDVLVNDILSSRFTPPYPEDIVDQICLAIEKNAEWRRRYDAIKKEARVKDDSDGSWVVNNRITKSVMKVTGMEISVYPAPATNGLMKSYSLLRYPAPPAMFQGFTPDAFAFMGELVANNNTAWMDDNRKRWHESVREPMRALFTDLGPHVSRLFDPYLLHDELEITPTTGKVLARINKDWTATPNSKYHEYYWGAFYRKRLTRQTDAQLFVNILPNHFCFGLSMGEKDARLKNRFRERVIADRKQFYDLITELGLIDGYDFIRTGSDDIRNMDPIRAIDDLSLWIENGRFDVVMPMTPQDVVAAGPNLADVILESFHRIFPIYLWAVIGDDDYKTIVADYLESEFPDPTDPDPPPTPYTFTDFTHDTHLTPERAEELWAMLKDKKQVIFFGPPGTGKTWVARRLARLLTGLADPPPERLTVVQFHAAYGYEEFIEGIRPRSERGEDGRALIDYPVRPGAFVRFCREAERVNGPCVFIIDEINRGNIPRIFGELMYLLEYRQKEDSIPLPYSGDRFRIPPNVYVIGTMNTADRSIALVDLALRRRFYFAEFAADPALFDRWLEAHPPAVPWLGTLYRALAERGIDDPAYAIGPSVFMRPGLDAKAISNIWKWSVMPYLREYHIDRPEAVRPWEWDSSELRELRAQDHNGEPADGNDG